MRISSICEGVGGRVAFHLSTVASLPDILENGLRCGNVPRYGHVGDGVYVFFADPGRVFAIASNLEEYLNFSQDVPVLIQTVVSGDRLLMDEDALDDEGNLAGLRFALNNRGSRESVEILEHFPVVVIEEILAALGDSDFKSSAIRIIDKYQIEPFPLFKVSMGHYSFETARSMVPVLPLKRVWVQDDSFEWVERDIFN